MIADVATTIATGPTTAQTKALIVCDMQPDLLKSLPPARRQALLDIVIVTVDAVRKTPPSKIIWTGVRFLDPTFASEVSYTHRLYGALRRLYDSAPKGTVQWFIQPYCHLTNKDRPHEDNDQDIISWRSQHLPLELAEIVKSQGIVECTVVGYKASYAIQAICQVLCDASIPVQVVIDAVEDDNSARRQAVIKHLLPIYAECMDLSTFLSTTVDMDSYQVPPQLHRGQKPWLSASSDEHTRRSSTAGAVRYFADCGRGGHGPIYRQHLMQQYRPCTNVCWRPWPVQEWYADHLRGQTYRCPVGKRVVDFCDEPQFSGIAMFLKGREWLDEKEKLITLRYDNTILQIPPTFVIRQGQWVDAAPPTSSAASEICWFLKEVIKNGGRAVQVCPSAEDALALAEARNNYVVQAHIPSPLLTDNGRKCHVKFYSLVTSDHTNGWNLYTYKDGFLSVSPNLWSAGDLSAETQITVKRNVRLQFSPDSENNQEGAVSAAPMENWTAAGSWPILYGRCRDAVRSMVRVAIDEGKLINRPPGRSQFEIFSADFMLDTEGSVWLIEFNFTPVLFDPLYHSHDPSRLTTDGLKRYHAEHLEMGDTAPINDHDMIRDAVSIVFDGIPVKPGLTKWEHAMKCDDKPYHECLSPTHPIDGS